MLNFSFLFHIFIYFSILFFSFLFSDSLSPDLNPNFAFQREAFGRQSMSEKRRGHLDARQTEFYQIAKSNRNVPGEYLHL